MKTGERVLHYRLERELGRGGMGIVWLAVDTRLEREVALKFLLGFGVLDDAMGERLAREARAASAIDHPGVVTVHAIEEAEAGPFVVMERVRGERIDRWVEERGRPMREALRLVREAAEAVGEAHAQGVVHRDLKPSNLLVDERGKARVLDFGLATVRDGPQLTRTGSTVGTLGYIAPEQLRGERVEAAADVFALGVVLHELLTGEGLFDRKQGAPGVIHDVLQLDAPSLAGKTTGLPRGVERVVAKALAKQPGERYPDARALAAALADCLDAESSSRIEALAEEQVWRHWLPKLAVLAVVLMGATGLAVRWLTSGGEAEAPAPPPFTDWRERPIQLFADGQREPDLSPDGRRLAFVAPVDGVEQLHVATLEDPAPQVLTREPRRVREPRWSPDGESILYLVEGPGDRPERRSVHVLPVLGGTARQVQERALSARWHPSGERILFEMYGLFDLDLATGEIATIDLPGVEESRRLWGFDPCWSPDGERIVLALSELGPLKRLAELDLARGELRLLTDDPTQVYDPIYTSDGRFVLFSGFEDTSLAIRAVDLSSGAATTITSGSSSDTAASLAGTGGRLAFHSLREEFRLVVWDPSVGESRVLQTSRHPMLAPRFSPDGARIAFFGGSGAATDVFVIDTAGGTPRSLTRSPEQMEIYPSFTRDGGRIAYYHETREGPSYDVLPVEGGTPRVLLEGWSMGNYPFADFSPTDPLVAALDSTDGGTLLFDLASQAQVDSAGSLFAARWSPDGDALVGDSPSGLITLYDRVLGTEREIARGDLPAWAPDGTIWFVRDSADARTLHSIRPDGSGESEHTTMGPAWPAAHSCIDINPDGLVVWAEYEEVSTEIVVLERPAVEE